MKLSKRWEKKTVEETVNSGVPSLPFERGLSAFLQAQDAMGHSQVTKSDYKSVLGLFLEYMRETHRYTSVDEIREEDVMEWLAHLRNGVSSRGRPYSRRTMATYCRDVLTFFHWLENHSYLATSPVGNVKEPKGEKPLIRVFSEEELRRLDAACERSESGRSITPDERKMLASRDRAILWLLLSTGIRLSELCGLRFCDLDWEKGMIYVMGKGAKERKVPMGKVARQHLNTYIVYWRGTPEDQEEAVFLSVFGQPIAQSAVKQMFARLKRIAGITEKRVSAHTCRHWFAVTMIKNGLPSTALQALLGHEQLEMINTYVRLAEQDHCELYARYSPVDGLAIDHSVKGKRERARDWRNSRKGSRKS